MRANRENICNQRSFSTIPLLLTLLSLGFYPATPALAEQITPVVFSSTTVETIIQAYAVRYGIPAKPLIETLRCESRFDPSAIGDKGTSFGIAQIHLPAHPDISKEEAMNPFFAIDWSARMFSLGKANMWSCYKLIYGNKSP